MLNVQIESSGPDGGRFQHRRGDRQGVPREEFSSAPQLQAKLTRLQLRMSAGQWKTIDEIFYLIVVGSSIYRISDKEQIEHDDFSSAPQQQAQHAHYDFACLLYLQYYNGGQVIQEDFKLTVVNSSIYGISGKEQRETHDELSSAPQQQAKHARLRLCMSVKLQQWVGDSGGF